jgi:hypothetical protein
MDINNSFEMLIGDTKNPSFVSEDKSARKERREARREERREKKYMDESKDFNLNAFINSLSSLKNSIIAQITDCDNRMDSKVLGGKVAAEKYKKVFMTHLEKVAVLLGEAQYRKNRGEGKKLEAGQDVGIVESFRENYTKLLEDFNKSAESYNTEAGKEVGSVVSKIEFKGIQEPLNAANKAFTEAIMLASDLLTDIRNTVAAEGGAGPAKTEDKKTKEEGKTTTSDIKVVNEIKAGTTPTGENAEIAKKVYALICEKWKDSKTLTATSQWKASGFCNPNKLIIGPNRSACIKAIKAAYKMEDKSGNLTQALVDKLASSEVIKESSGFNKISENLNLLSFEDFISGKSRIQEQIDMDALKASLKSGSSSSSKSTSSKSTGESPFKDKTEGDSFRKWVNDKHADWAKENKLDTSGSHTNSFILKAWNKFKDEYKPGTSGDEKSKEKSDVAVDKTKVSEEIENLMVTASDKIKDIFNDSSFWEEYKGSVNDDEEKAKVGFSDWWKSNIERNYLKPSKSKIDSLPKDSEEKEVCQKMYDTLLGLKSKIDQKIIGETPDDTATWKIYKLDGETESYKINTDF